MIDIVCGKQPNFGSCYWGHYDDQIGECVCTAGYTGSDCNTFDNTTNIGFVLGPVPSTSTPSSSVCISELSTDYGDYNGKYSYIQGSENDWGYPAYNSSDTGKYVYWNAYNHQWYIADYLPTGRIKTHIRAKCDVSEFTEDIADCTDNWQICKRSGGVCASYHDGSNFYISDTSSYSAFGDCPGSPTDNPTAAPTDDPTDNPSESPIRRITDDPSESPTPAPTTNPTPASTDNTTPAPTDNPTPAPTDNPTPAPTDDPTDIPTESPTTAQPTLNPMTRAPTRYGDTRAPTMDPTIDPTDNPTTTEPTEGPTSDPTTAAPTDEPTGSQTTAEPSANPSDAPTMEPTDDIATSSSTLEISNNPTHTPSIEPTEAIASSTSTIIIEDTIDTPSTTEEGQECPGLEVAMALYYFFRYDQIQRKCDICLYEDKGKRQERICEKIEDLIEGVVNNYSECMLNVCDYDCTIDELQVNPKFTAGEDSCGCNTLECGPQADSANRYNGWIMMVGVIIVTMFVNL